LLQELFTTDSTFIGISYLRISVGSSDLSTSVFSYDDIAGDTALTHFNINAGDKELIPVLQKIIALNPNIKILASPWSPPAWMKSSDSSVGGSLLSQYYSTYANYLVKYIQAMKANGINISALTPQNEPLYGGNNPSMLMQASDELNFVKNYLGPAFKAANITTKIIVYDHNCDRPDYPITILTDPQAAQYVDGSAFHLYGGDISALTTVHNAFPAKNVYFTEQWVGAPSNFGSDLQWHVKNLIIGATRNWSRNVLEWNLASDPYYNPHTNGGCNTCLGGITISYGTFVRNVGYYIVGHASKFVQQGAIRISSSYPTNLPNVAFQNPDGKKVLIVLNEATSSQAFNIQFNGKIVTTSLDAGAVGTFVW
jgi:O-Glycosyl hydrolase